MKQMPPFFVVRTHGGLGNQLFQILYAILLRNSYSQACLTVIHDSNYSHRFELDKNLDNAYSSKLGFITNLISNVRFAKIVSRLLGREIGFIKLGKYYFLDGYFQDASLYRDFSETEISAAITELKKCLVPDHHECKRNTVLYHFRLLDFFNSEDEELEYIKTQFTDHPENINIISNNDKLFYRPDIKRYLNDKNINYIETDGLAAIDVLLLMMKFGTIHSNNSTLAFWAAIFNRCKLVVDKHGLKNLFVKLREKA
jgi:hypothetical protein